MNWRAGLIDSEDPKKKLFCDESDSGVTKIHYNVRSHTFKYEKIELLVCIYERAGIHIRDFWSFWMEQSIWVFTCVATGNNQANVLIKYFR